ncbi:hypothetical protein AYP1020_p38 (plasmid) [Staphylococcus capitis subsp. capitis]|uniref:hypothetical protein n=1 Tax=Staphylococcus capitis TaxID=29388 RepID=UPI00064A5BEC|nr:hypothetical protein [Staphylococcus capitis]AKL93493.1 hypothetical protein AYP1020_p38 [Staphylococcus capitis subsp. capitis]
MNAFLQNLNHKYSVLEGIYFIDSRDKKLFDDFSSWEDYKGCAGYYILPMEIGFAALDVIYDEDMSFYKEVESLDEAIKFLLFAEQDDYYVTFIKDFKKDMTDNEVQMKKDKYEENIPDDIPSLNEFIDALDYLCLDTNKFLQYRQILKFQNDLLKDDYLSFKENPEDLSPLIEFVKSKFIDDLIFVLKKSNKM